MDLEREIAVGVILLALFITAVSGFNKVYDSYQHNKGTPIREWERVVK